ncbi:hypothetical protein LI177_05860 [bacterium 210820-DFI.6.37]|nr:hypothetical protein [bacterium 210820-DFI.6.37]
MEKITRKDNIPFVVKDCEKTRKVVNATPSKDTILKGKKIADQFALVNPKDKEKLLQQDSELSQELKSI